MQSNTAVTNNASGPRLGFRRHALIRLLSRRLLPFRFAEWAAEQPLFLRSRNRHPDVLGFPILSSRFNATVNVAPDFCPLCFHGWAVGLIVGGSAKRPRF